MGITVPKVAGFNTMLILPSLSENITSGSNINTEMLIEVYNNFTLFKVLKMILLGTAFSHYVMRE